MPSPNKCKTRIPVTPRERQVRDAYGRIDAATERELRRLRREEGIVPSCRRGCCGCCGQHILTNPAEAHALGQYIKRTFTVKQIGDLRQRTRMWVAWEDVRRNEGHPDDRAISPELLGYVPCCPLLADRACSAYPARPVICRTHFVSSDPVFCRPSHDNRPVDSAPEALASVLRAAQPSLQLFRAEIEVDGTDASRSIMLLPHWLAVEMGWGFATSF